MSGQRFITAPLLFQLFTTNQCQLTHKIRSYLISAPGMKTDNPTRASTVKKHLLITTLMRLKGEAPIVIDAGTGLRHASAGKRGLLAPLRRAPAQALYPPEIQQPSRYGVGSPYLPMVSEVGAALQDRALDLQDLTQTPRECPHDTGCPAGSWC